MQLLLHAHQLAAESSFGQALDLLLAGRQTGLQAAPGSYNALLSSWRFHTFLPVYVALH